MHIGKHVTTEPFEGGFRQASFYYLSTPTAPHWWILDRTLALSHHSPSVCLLASILLLSHYPNARVDFPKLLWFSFHCPHSCGPSISPDSVWETEVPPPPSKTIKASSYLESFPHSWLSPENSQDSSCKSDLTFTVNIFLQSFCISGASHTQGKQALSVSSCAFGAPRGNTHSVWLRLSWGLVKKIIPPLPQQIRVGRSQASFRHRCPSRSGLESLKHPSSLGASGS